MPVGVFTDGLSPFVGTKYKATLKEKKEVEQNHAAWGKTTLTALSLTTV